MSIGVTSHQMSDGALKGTIKDVFHLEVEDQKPVWKESGFEEQTTKDPFEEYSSVTGLGLAPEKRQLAQIAIDTPKQNATKRITVTAYAIMMPISEEAKRWKKYKEMYNGSKLVAESLHLTTEFLAADLLGNAFSPTIGPGVDGQPLVSTVHKLGGGGTYSNHLGAVSLSQQSLEAALVMDRKMPNDKGISIGNKRGKRLLIVNEDNYFKAKRILGGTMQSDTANNTINVLKDENIEIRANRYLPSTSNWFIRNMGVKNGLIVLFETKPDMREHGDDKTYAMFFSGYECLGVDYIEPRAIMGSSI